jgi:hypothetical protein
MGHYAKIVDGKVTQVIVAEPDFFKTFVDSSPGAWLQTSYNTIGNKHLLDGTPFRGNYAGVGYIYDAKNDVFYAPQPFPSWVLDEKTWTWDAPISVPKDGKSYVWDESTKNWVEKNV